MKRATVSAKFNAKRNVISIHALVKRATHFKKSDELKNGISIHALVKRATQSCGRHNIIGRFQSTPS